MVIQFFEEMDIMREKFGYFIGVLILGSVVMAVVDDLVGVSYANAFAEIIHNLAYMLWGACLTLFMAAAYLKEQ